MLEQRERGTLFVCSFVCLLLCLSICLFAYLFLYLLVRLLICLFACSFVSLSICLFAYLFVCLFVCLFIALFVYLFVYYLVCLFIRLLMCLLVCLLTYLFSVCLLICLFICGLICSLVCSSVALGALDGVLRGALPGSGRVAQIRSDLVPAAPRRAVVLEKVEADRRAEEHPQEQELLSTRVGLQGEWYEAPRLPIIKNVHSPNLLKRSSISEVVRIGSVIIFHLSKLWKAKFFILWDVIILARLQGKFEIYPSNKPLYRTISSILSRRFVHNRFIACVHVC